MAWFGEITAFQQRSDGWFLAVDYFNDVNPDIRFQRSGVFPLDSTKAQIVAWIKARGVEVIRVATINEENVVGQRIPIP